MPSPNNHASNPTNFCIFHHISSCDTFYNLPSQIGNNRSAGIGKGTKLTFGKKKNVPAPGNYNIKSNFDQKNHGVKFSLGR